MDVAFSRSDTGKGGHQLVQSALCSMDKPGLAGYLRLGHQKGSQLRVDQ
jgi:hypothetical protein